MTLLSLFFLGQSLGLCKFSVSIVVGLTTTCKLYWRAYLARYSFPTLTLWPHLQIQPTLPRHLNFFFSQLSLLLSVNQIASSKSYIIFLRKILDIVHSRMGGPKGNISRWTRTKSFPVTLKTLNIWSAIEAHILTVR